MITDKLEPNKLVKIFDIINTHFGIDDVKLSTLNDTTLSQWNIYIESFWDDSTQTLAHTITIVDGELNYGDYYEAVYHRLFRFIEYLGIELNAVSRTAMMLCHEYGHINRINTMYMFNQEDICALIDNITDSILDNRNFEAMAAQVIKTDDLDLKYMLSSTEMYADWFALKNFIPVYEKLKEVK